MSAFAGAFTAEAGPNAAIRPSEIRTAMPDCGACPAQSITVTLRIKSGFGDGGCALSNEEARTNMRVAVLLRTQVDT